MDRAASFVRSRSAAWTAFERDLSALRRGTPMAPERVIPFARAYRDVAADLSAARAMECGAAVRDRLNRLVSEAHAVVYRRKVRPSTERRRSPLARVLLAVPRTFLAHPRTAALSVSLLLLPAAMAYLYVAGNERRIHEFIPDMGSVIHPGEDGQGKSINAMPMTFSAVLMVHNSMVGLVYLAYGMLLGAGTAWFLSVNGVMLGALAAHFRNQGALASFWPQVLPHGVTELLGILAACQAGFLLARAIWTPGEYSRLDALAVRGREAGALALGTVVLMIWSGFVESLLTRSTGDDALRNGFAALAAVAVACWFLLAARAGPGPEEDGDPTAAARP